MNCEQVREYLSPYLDSMLTEKERREVAAHLERCSACQQVLADYRNFDTLLTQLPRVGPDPALRTRIFSSPEYKELNGTYASKESGGVHTTPPKRLHSHDQHERPKLVALPGGRQTPLSPIPSQSTNTSPIRIYPKNGMALQKSQMRRRGRPILYGMIAASILLAMGIGGLISWKLFQKQPTVTQNERGITPPAGLSQGPLPAGTRFLFLREGALWSGASGDAKGVARLTPEGVMVAPQWIVRPGQFGRKGGNMLAYIDLQRGEVHTIRSDGQNDTVIPQPLLLKGTQPTTIWDTAKGHTILSSLSWSKDGTKLAFVAEDEQESGQTSLYIYQLTTHKVDHLPTHGKISQPVWSPDSKRIAFQVTQDGVVGIADYNSQNQGMLTIAAHVNSTEHPDDTVLQLGWSSNSDLPVITWSVGVIGHVHSLWSQQVGMGEKNTPQRLQVGDYVQATYSPTGSTGGVWLLITAPHGLRGDIYTVDLNAFSARQTQGMQASMAQWSPDGQEITYFDASTSGAGTLHLLDRGTATDTLLANGVQQNPAPAWSADQRQLAYSMGNQIFLYNVKEPAKENISLKLPGQVMALSWSVSNPAQLVVALSDGQEGLYLVEGKRPLIQLDRIGMAEEIQWTLIP